jgi:hypothetical protein
MHACHPLYSLCHALHHRARFPTLLDAGTISPLELLLTELSLPALVLLWPPVISVGYELGYSMVGHFTGHTTGFPYAGSHHHKVCRGVSLMLLHKVAFFVVVSLSDVCCCFCCASVFCVCLRVRACAGVLFGLLVVFDLVSLLQKSQLGRDVF